MAEFSAQTRRALWQFMLIFVLIGIGYTCIVTLRSTIEALNFYFVCAFFALPFLAIRPALLLRQWSRFFAFVFLLPLLLISSCTLAFTVGFDGPSWANTHTEPLQTFHLGNSTVQLERYDHGGALGLHGLELMQRRLIVPGLLVHRSIDFFEDATEGTLTVEGQNRVRVVTKGSYSSYNSVVDKVYSLKPWVYF